MTSYEQDSDELYLPAGGIGLGLSLICSSVLYQSSAREGVLKQPPYIQPKEDIKEQLTPRNLSATAARVLQCICIVAASRKDCSAIANMIWYMCTKLVVRLENDIYVASGCFRRFSWELCTAVNLFGIKIYLSLVGMAMSLTSYICTVFTIWHKFRSLGVGESVTYQTHLADEVLKRQNFVDV